MLWYTLALTGYNFAYYKLSPTSKIFRMLFLVSFAVTFFYFTALYLCFPENNSIKNSLEIFYYLLTQRQCGALLIPRRKLFHICRIRSISRMKVLQNFKEKNVYILVISLTFFVLFFSFFVVYSLTQNEFRRCWLYSLWS